MLFKSLVLAILLAGHLRDSFQISLPTDPTYHAGVVEFAPTAGTGKQKVRDNLRRMRDIIESESTRNLDILVFPEGNLNDQDFLTYVPDPERKIAPCDIPDYDFFLSELSCAARSRKLYIVINISEKEHCAGPAHKGKTCDPSGLNKYNTNVVFDRQGRVISRYRKTHLYRYEWYRYNILPKAELATFETDFGVTFGHFICFDMLFDEPALKLIRELNISDIIYPTYWFSELPFLTALQLQEGWSYTHDVNLLAADVSIPSERNTGSGIYAGRLGRLAATINEVATTTLLTAQVPKRNRRSDYQLPPVVIPQFVPQLETRRLTKMALERDYNLDIFETKLLNEDFSQINETLCHGQFCCRFNIQRLLISNSVAHSAYRFRLVAYDGSQTTFQRIDHSEIAVCALVACTNAELYSCAHIFPENVLVGNKYYFASISINAALRNSPRRSILPSSVDGAMMPLSLGMYKFKEEDGVSTTAVTMDLISPKSDILTFGFWANYYSKVVAKHNLDPPAPLRSSSGKLTFSSVAGALVGLLFTKSLL